MIVLCLWWFQRTIRKFRSPSYFSKWDILTEYFWSAKVVRRNKGGEFGLLRSRFCGKCIVIFEIYDWFSASVSRSDPDRRNGWLVPKPYIDLWVSGYNVENERGRTGYGEVAILLVLIVWCVAAELWVFCECCRRRRRAWADSYWDVQY